MIPANVGLFISLLKDTTLVTIVGLLGAARDRPRRARPVGVVRRATWRSTSSSPSSSSCCATPCPRRAIGWSGSSGWGLADDASFDRTRWIRGRRRNPGPRDAAGERERDHRRARRPQVVRPAPRAARHRPDRRRAGEVVVIFGAVGLGQVDVHPHHQPPRGAPARRDHRGRHRADQRHPQHRRRPQRDRHGLPVVQPVPAPDRAPEHHPGADAGAQVVPRRCRGGRHGAADARRHPGAGAQVPGAALRRAAAARGDRAGAGHAARRSCSSTSPPPRSTPR